MLGKVIGNSKKIHGTAINCNRMIEIQAWNGYKFYYKNFDEEIDLNDIVSFDEEAIEMRISVGYQEIIFLKKVQVILLNSEMSSSFSKIEDEWKLDSQAEDNQYFFITDTTKKICKGNHPFLIGRKGTGKTAIGEYLLKQESEQHFTRKESFKSFPYNILYENYDSNYTLPNQYISLWKLTIYSILLDMFIKHVPINSETKYKKFLLNYKKNKKNNLEKNISYITGADFGLGIAQLFDVNAGFSRDVKAREVSLSDRVDCFEEILLEILGDYNYTIIFDELDDDYSTVTSSIEKRDSYFYLLTGLMKAVLEVKRKFANQNVMLVVLLREDIYERIEDPDKSKWKDYMVNISWDNKSETKKMLAHRLSKTLGSKKTLEFDEIWPDFFEITPYQYLSEKNRMCDLLTYFKSYSLGRPRDYIEWIRECSRLAIENKRKRINEKIVKEASKLVSKHVLDEFKDEMVGVDINFDQCIAVLSQILGKKVFSSYEFVYAYKKKYPEKSKEEIFEILELLFIYSVIGLRSKTKEHLFQFSFSNEYLFNKEGTYCISAGLWNCLRLTSGNDEPKQGKALEQIKEELDSMS